VLPGGLRQPDAHEDDDAAANLPRREDLIEPEPGHDRGEHRLDGGHQTGGGGRQVAQRGDREPERDHRPHDDDPADERPQRQVRRSQ
jgi:hypothetical protein